jgi:hypothetical protein
MLPRTVMRPDKAHRTGTHHGDAAILVPQVTLLPPIQICRHQIDQAGMIALSNVDLPQPDGPSSA